ncbi:GGDEF domain-containing protein [Fusibacter sp. 3D3]|uniref:GGDEF domain-containing protein n=1 Tax=Fusibacter sp. 3D3 TaxID=1048380 RepID=UPI000853846A|nr:GGDEF domain-containing protein [Fusibacter sp. 3D3]GAU76976.1 sensory box/GGDEF family protein [Fusibacter sp. 3D3]
MAVFLSLLFAVISALISYYGLVIIAPKFNKQPRFKHVITVVYLSAFMFYYDGTQLLHILVLYGSIILMLMMLYKLSSFISAVTVVLLFLLQTIASLITVNIGFLTYNRIFDFRLLFLEQYFPIVGLYFVLFFFILKFYQLIMKVFRNMVSINKRVERRLVISNFLIFTAILAYQRVTFSSLIEIALTGVINKPGTSNLNLYMLVTYLFITVISLTMVLLINRNFIVDNNLERYKYKAEIDQMTGVLSREAGISYLKAEMTRASLQGLELTIAYVDVNDLKVVNDRYGHKEGDKLIKVIVDTIQSNLREFDVIARLGGDEFMVIFSRCGVQQAKKVWQRINDEFLQVNLQNVYRFSASASAGFSQYQPSKHRNPSEFLHEADEAMYVIKKQTKEKSKY